MKSQLHAQYLESTEICGNFIGAPVLRVTAQTSPTSRQLHAQIDEYTGKPSNDRQLVELISERQKVIRLQMTYAVSTHNAAAFKLGKARLARLADKIRAHIIAIELLDIEIKGL
jgi:hypothetical protein